MSINSRVGLMFLVWLVVVGLTSWAIGPERKRQWFRTRDVSKSFFNRRGMLGEFLHFGVPRTPEGWAVFAGFMAMIVITGYFAVSVDS